MYSSDAAPYVLLDSTGSRANTRLVDNEQGQCYDIRAADGSQQQRIIRFYRNRRPEPAAAITFRLHAPPLISFEKWEEPQLIDTFLPRISLYKNKLSRCFVAKDGQTYTWTRNLKENEEWTCTNKRDYHVAYYSLPSEVHPKPYLFIDESFTHLDLELIAALYAARLLHE